MWIVVEVKWLRVDTLDEVVHIGTYDTIEEAIKIITDPMNQFAVWVDDVVDLK